MLPWQTNREANQSYFKSIIQRKMLIKTARKLKWNFIYQTNTLGTILMHGFF